MQFFLLAPAGLSPLPQASRLRASTRMQAGSLRSQCFALHGGLSHKQPVSAFLSGFIVFQLVMNARHRAQACAKSRTRKDQQGRSFLGVFINRVVFSLSTFRLLCGSIRAQVFFRRFRLTINLTQEAEPRLIKGVCEPRRFRFIFSFLWAGCT